jgi:hypothetical protein
MERFISRVRLERRGSGCLELFAGIMMSLNGAVPHRRLARGDHAELVLRLTPSYVFSFNITAWAWLHFVLGIFVGGTGIALAAKQSWAQVVGMIIAGLSALGNFVFLPYQPVWSLLIITVDVAVIRALAVNLRELPAEESHRGGAFPFEK